MVLTVPWLPACAASPFPEPRTLNPTSHSRPVPPHFILPPFRDLGIGGTGWRVPLDSAVRAGLEGECSCPKMVTFIPFFKLKRGGEFTEPTEVFFFPLQLKASCISSLRNPKP